MKVFNEMITLLVLIDFMVDCYLSSSLQRRKSRNLFWTK